MVEMSLAALQYYIRTFYPHVPWGHWFAMGAISLAVSLIFRKRFSFYGAVVLGFTVFVSLFLLEVAVVIRYCGFFPHGTGFGLIREFHLLLHGDEIRRAELLSNIVVFVPFGFFLSEFLSSTKTHSILKRFENVTFAAFGLSLCIEALQLLLQVGYFEMTDLIMNTVGAFIGAGVSILIRTAFGKARRHENL